MPGLTRRDFFTGLAIGIPAAILTPLGDSTPLPDGDLPRVPEPRVPDPWGAGPVDPSSELNLSPAQWIWYPSERCLANTFVFFRREISLPAPVRRAEGWICADSRYLLHVNGERIQWGPAPSDPRWMEADPLDLTRTLKAGKNVIGATVLFFGHGDGTWPTGKPGFIFRLEIETADGATTEIVSDSSWQCCLARSWQPGHYKRWFVRSLQEEFDARLYPHGWHAPSFRPGRDWLKAMPLPDATPADPPVTSRYREYALDLRGDPKQCELRRRSVPLMHETFIGAKRLAESLSIIWMRTPEEYFECLTPGSFTSDRRPCAAPDGGHAWKVVLEKDRGSALTFEMEEEAVGWPSFTIDAPAGTVVEVMVQEFHEPGGSPLLNTHYHSWTRFVCDRGVNRFEAFDYEAVKWLQLHIHGRAGVVRVDDVGIRRRSYPWSFPPVAETNDPAINRLIGASINTLNNSILEIAVDGVGRERQQYSGDGSHQLHAVYLPFGEYRLPARFVSTFSQGITEEGYFLDCWPAYDRLARLWERQMHLSYWGPLVDHGVGFVFDCHHYYMYTGDREALSEAFPRLLRFFRYLRSLRREDGGGLLPVEGLGVPSVYIDHLAYTRQRHKQCAFNLYAAAMLEHALAPLCRLFGEEQWEEIVRRDGRELLAATQKMFWDKRRGVYVANLPWEAEEKEVRTCDRSLALSVLYDLSPAGGSAPALEMLAAAPASMGFSYPANACWRLWALAKGGRPDVILNDFRTRWTAMESVRFNNTLQEFWTERPDGGSVMSHSCPVPLYLLYMGLAGIQPLAPGFSRCMVRPQPGDLTHLALKARTVRGDLIFRADGSPGDRSLSVTMPGQCTGELVVSEEESLPLEPWPAEPGLRRYLLPAGETTTVRLRYS